MLIYLINAVHVNHTCHALNFDQLQHKLDLSFLDKPAPSKRKISEVKTSEEETEEIHKRIKNNEQVTARQLMQAIQSLLS